MAEIMDLLGELQRRGFLPDMNDDWFDLDIGRDDVLDVEGTVRVAPDDGWVNVYAMTGNGVMLWEVRLSPGTPLAVVTTVVDQAVAHVLYQPWTTQAHAVTRTGTYLTEDGPESGTVTNEARGRG